jgi:hypothetical protein
MESRLVSASELMPPKPHPEVIVIGSAHAPTPAASTTVRIALGAWNKSLHVDASQPWSQRLLTDIAPPAGWGPVSPRSPERSRYLRPGIRWSDTDLTAFVIGSQIDPYFFQCAPKDQWLERIDPGAELRLHHLHPDHEDMVVALPSLTPLMRVSRKRVTSTEVSMRADTLLVDTDKGTLNVLWRAETRLDGPEEAGDLEIGFRDDDGDHWPTWKAGSDAVQVPQTDIQTLRIEPTSHPSSSLPRERAVTVTHDHPIDLPATGPGWLEPKPLARSSPPPLAPARSQPPPLPPRSQPPPPIPEPVVSPPASLGSASIQVRPRPLMVPNPARDMIDRRRDAPNAPERDPASPVPRPTADAPPSAAILLWFDEEHHDALRSAFPEAVKPEEAPALPSKPKRGEPPPPPPAVPLPSAKTDSARSDFVRVLNEVGGVPLAQLELRMITALSKGDHQPPLLVLDGELCFLFDETRHLDVCTKTAKAFSTNDKNLVDTMAVAEAALENGAADAPRIAQALRHRVEGAWKKANRSLPDDHLEVTVSRTLLNERAFDTRFLWGGPHLHTRLESKGDTVPLYLPSAVKDQLPLFARLPVRLLAEAHPKQDSELEHSVALRAFAVLRVLQAGQRKP